MNTHNRIILVGRAASGKDYIRKKLETRGFKYAISYTTRPPRKDEVNGVDYIFISDAEAVRMIEAGEFYEYVYFNGWTYGTSVEQFNTDEVFIMTPSGISHIKPEDRKHSFIIYFDISEESRRQRLLERDMPGDSVDRRIEADRLDFDNFVDYDMRITNNDF